jgi:spore maturation protein CgeB
MPKKLRLLKFDSAHPFSYLVSKQRQAATELESLDYEKYYHWLMAQRLGLSDHLTYFLNQAGWQAREYLPGDRILARKLSASGEISGRKMIGLKAALKQAAGTSLKDLLHLRLHLGWEKQRLECLMENYIETFRPDVIFVREPCHLDGRFFNRFRKKCVIAGFIACNTNHPINWDAHRHDLLFTLTPEYVNFFKVQGIETHLLEYGVDERIAREVADLPKIHDCTFVGYLGTQTQTHKTRLMDAVATSMDFKWWGVKGTELAKFPALERSWQGETAGIDMLRIYKQSRMVLNDYVDMAAGVNVNMRTKEVMNVGSMLLTRRASNIEVLEREGALATFGDAEECLGKIRYYLDHEKEREAIAAKGLQLAMREFNYRDISAKLMQVLESKVKQCERSWS